MADQSASKNPSLLKMTLGLSIGILFSACDHSETGAAVNAPASQAEARSAAGDAFAKELLALKSQNVGQKVSDEDIAALLSKYNLPNPSLDVPMAEQPDPALEENKSLGKSAAGSVYIPVRKAGLNLNMTLYVGATVQSGAKLEAWTTRTADNQNVDPFLIAYYKLGGDDIGSTIKVVAMNDDYPGTGVDPYISWVNNTGAAVGIEIVAFGYSIGTSGLGTLKVKTNVTRTYAGRFGGIYQFKQNATSAKPLDGCSYNSDELIMTRNISDSEPGFFIGVNATYNAGAILGSDNSIGGSAKTSVRLPVGLSGTWPDFVLSFVPWRAGTVFNATSYTPIQYQKYSCP